MGGSTAGGKLYMMKNERHGRKLLCLGSLKEYPSPICHSLIISDYDKICFPQIPPATLTAFNLT